MNKPTAARSYYPALDGLRGVGCFLIVIYHNFVFLQQYFFFSFLAMDIFFVLSGFLITNILLNTKKEKGYLKNFYARRILRVFPLYYFLLILFFIVFPFIKSIPFRFDYFTSRQAWFWTFTQNWVLIFDHNNNQNALNHLWSMAVEEQFYLLWPLSFAIIKKPKTLLILVSVLLIAFSAVRYYLWISHIKDFPYFNFYSFTRIDGICIGCIVALLRKIDAGFLGRNILPVVLSFAAFNFLFYYINLQHQNSFPYLALLGFSTFSMVFGILVNAIVNGTAGFLNTIFDLKPLRFIGRISYGTYIFHWPLYLFISPFLLKSLLKIASPYTSAVINSTIVTIAAYLIGYLSYRYFETYFLKLKKGFK